MSYFLARNRAVRAMHLTMCNPRFSWREIALEMTGQLSSRSKTCLLCEYVVLSFQ